MVGICHGLGLKGRFNFFKNISTILTLYGIKNVVISLRVQYEINEFVNLLDNSRLGKSKIYVFCKENNEFLKRAKSQRGRYVVFLL